MKIKVASAELTLWSWGEVGGGGRGRVNNSFE